MVFICFLIPLPPHVSFNALVPCVIASPLTHSGHDDLIGQQAKYRLRYNIRKDLVNILES